MAKKPASAEPSVEKPEPTTAEALQGCGIVIGLGVAIVFLFNQCSGNSSDGPTKTGKADQPSVVSEDHVAAFKATPVDAKHGAKCAGTGIVTQTDFGVQREQILRMGPKEDAKELKGTLAGSIFPAKIDEEFDVREVCRLGGWSEVRTLVPQDVRSWRGWVPTSALRPAKTDAKGRRIYTSADFEWPAGTGSDRARVVKVVNRIMAERSTCEAIDPASLAKVSDGPNSMFMVGCVGEEYQTVQFSPADADNGRDFAVYAPIDKGVAFGICKDAARARTNHPSTFEMSAWDVDFRDDGDGRTQIISSFSARNAFNLELTFDVVCDFTGETLTDVRISEQ